MHVLWGATCTCEWLSSFPLNDECVWRLSKWESGSIRRFHPELPPASSPHLPLSSHSCLLSVALSPGFDLRQNSIPQFHTLSAVDKGPLAAAGAQRETQRALRMAEDRIPQDNEVHL